MMLVKKSSFFMECFPGQKRSARVGGYIPGRKKVLFKYLGHP